MTVREVVVKEEAAAAKDWVAAAKEAAVREAVEAARGMATIRRPC